MSKRKKKIEEYKIEFAPGCFDSFDGNQEELNEMVAMIRQMIESGELLEKSRPMTEEDYESMPEEARAALEAFILDEEQPDRKLN